MQIQDEKETLLCTFGDCDKPQVADMEYCSEEHQKMDAEIEYSDLPQDIREKIDQALTEDILERYDNSEYWDWELAQEVAKNHGYQLS